MEFIQLYLLGYVATLLVLVVLSVLSVAAGREPMSIESEAKVVLKLATVWPVTLIVIVGFALDRLINH